MDSPSIGQKRRRWAFGVLLATGALITGVRSAAAGGYSGRIEERSRVCAAHDVLRVAEGPEYMYQGKTYYFCYPRCLKQFKSAPERLSQATDPVSGESVDKAKGPIYAAEGKVYYFSTEEHLSAFVESPEVYLGQLSKRKGTGSR